MIIDLQEEYKRLGLAEKDLDNHMDLEPEDFFDRESEKLPPLLVPIIPAAVAGTAGAISGAGAITCAIL